MRWWRVFIDRLTGKSKDPGVVGPRRRKSPRYAYEVQLTAKCSSWPKFVELFSDNVSAGGFYIPTDRVASIGEGVEIELTVPDGSTLKLRGHVVSVIDAQRAARFGKRPGLGVAVDEIAPDARARFEQLLAAARAAAPVPAEVTAGDPIPTRPATEPPMAAQPLPAPQRAAPVPPPPPGAKPPVAFREPDTPTATEPAPAPPAQAPTPPSAAPAPATRSTAARAADSGPVVGIDLGTTFSSVAAVVGKKVTVLTWPDGARSWPSVVSFPSAHEIIVGAEARRRLATDPAHTVASPKRLLGRKYDDKEIQSFLGQAPYRTVPGPDGSVVVEIWGQQYAVTQLCAYIVEQARKVAETHLGCEVHRCVMTVPVSFDEQRARIFRRAAELAQLEVLAMIDEPSAAALANRFDPNFGGIVGVYDFGGGTFDFSIVDVSRGDFQVLATAGDTWLGGDDFDAVLAEAAANQFWRMHKVDLRKQAVEWQKLVFACERAKRALTVDAEARIHVPEVLRSARGMVDLDIRVDRATFERACRPVIERSLATCDEALELLDMKRSDLSTIYLSGGTTYIPAVRQALAAHFGVPVRTGVPPEHAVCLGAAIHAAQLQFQSATTLDAR